MITSSVNVTVSCVCLNISFRKLSATAVLSFGIWGATAPGGAQGLGNGDFEEAPAPGGTPTGWTVEKGKFTVDAQKRKQGRTSGKLDGASGAGAAVQDFPVLPGATYTLTGMWRNGDKTADFDVARISVKWLTTPGGDEVGDGGQIDSGPVVGEWTPFTLSPLATPANVTGARIRLTSTFGIAAFDGLTWVEGAAPAASVGATVSAPPAASAPAPAARPASVGTSGIPWQQDLLSAYRTAGTAKKRVLVYFSGNDTCSQYYDQTLFSDPAIQSLIINQYLPVKMPFSGNESTAQKLRVTGPGTVVLYGPDGSALGAITEQLSVAAFETKLRQ